MRYCLYCCSISRRIVAPELISSGVRVDDSSTTGLLLSLAFFGRKVEAEFRKKFSRGLSEGPEEASGLRTCSICFLIEDIGSARSSTTNVGLERIILGSSHGTWRQTWRKDSLPLLEFNGISPFLQEPVRIILISMDNIIN